MYVDIQVDFYYDTFRSGVVQVPEKLWSFDRTKPSIYPNVYFKGAGFISKEEYDVYRYVQTHLSRIFREAKTLDDFQLILLKKI